MIILDGFKHSNQIIKFSPSGTHILAGGTNPGLFCYQQDPSVKGEKLFKESNFGYATEMYRINNNNLVVNFDPTTSNHTACAYRSKLGLFVLDTINFECQPYVDNVLSDRDILASADRGRIIRMAYREMLPANIVSGDASLRLSLRLFLESNAPNEFIYQCEYVDRIWQYSALCVSNDLKYCSVYCYIVSAALVYQKIILVVERKTGKVLSEYRMAGSFIHELLFCPNKPAVVGRAGKSLYVFVLGESKMRIIKNENRMHFTNIAFHPSGDFLAATSNDHTVKIYETNNWQLVQTLSWELGRLCSVDFSPDGTMAAAGTSNGKVIVWDFEP